MRERYTPEELANVREHIKQERFDAIQSFRHNWRTNLAMVACDLACNAMFGFAVGLIAVLYTIQPMLLEFAKQCTP